MPQRHQHTDHGPSQTHEHEQAFQQLEPQKDLPLGCRVRVMLQLPDLNKLVDCREAQEEGSSY